VPDDRIARARTYSRRRSRGRFCPVPAALAPGLLLLRWLLRNQEQQRRFRLGRDRNDGEGAVPWRGSGPLVLVRSEHVVTAEDDPPLPRERTRIEHAIAALDREGPLEASDRGERGDQGFEDLYQDEFDEGRREGLNDDLAALERAEARLEAGTYGLTVDSGEPIPDDRLATLPTAERTVEEESRYRHGSG
jgi:DnaK suppressor protein